VLEDWAEGQETSGIWTVEEWTVVKVHVALNNDTLLIIVS
jgi:hypothetical protein